MQSYIDDTEETLSLSNFHLDDDTIDSSSSSSSSLSDQDFVGFFSEEWSGNTSYSNLPENIVFCGKVVSSGQPISRERTKSLFRSNSDSFRFMSLKSASKKITSRSKSMPNGSSKSSPCKSRFMVFLFGSGSSKFQTKVDMSDIKSRQLRQQSSKRVPGWIGGGDKEESGVRRSGNNGWWRFVDVLGCGSGYERDTVRVM